MSLFKPSFLIVLALVTLFSLINTFAQSVDPNAEDDFDRLDGKGKSGVRVDVIEWANNLEIHVYPAGALAGLSAKLDKRNKEKPVMVLGYRFRSQSQNLLIRRAILGIPLTEGFKAYQDRTVSEYDKIIISNNTLGGKSIAYQLEAPPTQLYPEGHPAILAQEPAKDENSQARQPATEAATEEPGIIKPFRW